MRYQLIVDGIDPERGKQLYAELIGVQPREVFGNAGLTWGPASLLHSDGSVMLKPLADPVVPKAVPFCLVRMIENPSRIATFGGYIGEGQFIAVDHSTGQTHEEHAPDWECIDGHSNVINWPDA
jgi:hypothetical protein